MTTPKWDEVDRVWQAVLSCPDHERAATLEKLCAGDESLRHEVESLLTHRARASAAGFGANPSTGNVTGESLIGRRMGAYTIHSLLGAGGMGEVYQAHDATLEREVAIKILPNRWLAGSERRARFEREARLLASLSHPNIGAIFGVYDADGVHALVLELVEGETLAERIARQVAEPHSGHGLPLRDVVTIATAVARGIEAAHERGVIHRDLKPANIKVTRDLRVKVLDFGLARAARAPAGELQLGNPSPLRTDETHEGALLGTPAYMSPEQARHLPADTRSDIWAFGCVLYEMLTGRQAFRGNGVQEILAAIIGGEPDWNALPHDTPPTLRLCVRRCMRNDPRERFQHIGDVRLALQGAFDLSADSAAHAPRGKRLAARAAYAGWAAAAVGVLALVLIATAPPADESIVSTATNPSVLLNPKAGGGGRATAATIREAVDAVARGGTVSVLPGTYAERLTITKGVTLEATGERTGPVIMAPPGSPESVIEIATTEPVVLRGLTVRVSGISGIRGVGGVNLTVDRSTILAVNPPSGTSALIDVRNDLQTSGARARVVVRRSNLDGSVTKLPPGVPRPMSHAVRLIGDIDASLDGNMVRRTGGMCINVSIRDDLGGETNVDILNNDIDECHPVARVAAIKVGVPTVTTMSPEQTITAVGVVNIVGNTIRNSSEDCLNNAIAFDALGGRIERNRIVNFVQPCASPNTRTLPAAIWLGLRNVPIALPATAPRVRFNDISGNAHAGLSTSRGYPVAIDASCNFWGSDRGPSGIGNGAGDKVVVAEASAAPRLLPFATKPIAKDTSATC